MCKTTIKILKIIPIKRGISVDSFLHVAKMSMHMNKWLTAEQWVDIIKSLFDFNRKEEELDGNSLIIS